MHDLPEPPSLVVTEHRAHAVRCLGCRACTRTAFPAGVEGPVRFGPRLAALAAYLRVARLRERTLAIPVASMDETEHGICNAHLLRNLEEIVELEQELDGWAARLQRLLLGARDTAAATTWPWALWDLRDACLLFMADPRVPSPHNLAEQALRMAKLQMKISGCFRTWDGAARFARMWGLIETARKRGQSLLDLLRLDPVPP